MNRQGDDIKEWIETLPLSDQRLLRDWRAYSAEMAAGWLIVPEEQAIVCMGRFYRPDDDTGLEEFKDSVDCSWELDMFQEALPKLRSEKR